MKYGLLVFEKSLNLGDDIQSYAVERFLPHTDYIIERERMDEFYTEDGTEVAVILAGWFLYNHLHWPPSPFIHTLPISMHFDDYFSRFAGEKLTRNFVLEEYGAEWLVKNGPVGCRDYNTSKILDKFGIPNYFSGCITLTLDSFEDIIKRDIICLVDLSDDIKAYVQEKSNAELIELSHTIRLEGMSWKERKKIVEERLKIYQSAKMVVTTRLHVALPCLALGTPVLLIQEEWSLNRIGTWLQYLQYTSKDKLFSGEYKYDFNNPKENDNIHLDLAQKLTKKCMDFIEKCEEREKVVLDVEMFLENRKRIDSLQKLFALRVDKFEKELYGH